MTLLFVDEDDAARAPLAAGIARHLADSLGLDVDAYSAGVRPSHVRPEVRKMLREIGAAGTGLHAKPLLAVPLDEVTLVVRLSPDLTFRFPYDVPMLDWHLPDPTSAPADEREDAYRATRDELTRRLKLYFSSVSAGASS
jgi:protein-tyrosine-phosphatase